MKHGGGWRGSLPELAIAAVFVVVLAGAAFAWAGADGAAVVVAVCGLCGLVLLRTLPIQSSGLRTVPGQAGWRYTGQRSISGFWRRRSSIQSATASMASYDLELRATLQHLLAARLAERHSVSLYADPAAARRLFLAEGGSGGLPPGAHRRADDRLWQWLDPAKLPTAGPPDPTQPGIPPRTLAAILHRLEHL